MYVFLYVFVNKSPNLIIWNVHYSAVNPPFSSVKKFRIYDKTANMGGAILKSEAGYRQML